MTDHNDHTRTTIDTSSSGIEDQGTSSGSGNSEDFRRSKLIFALINHLKEARCASYDRIIHYLSQEFGIERPQDKRIILASLRRGIKFGILKQQDDGQYILENDNRKIYMNMVCKTRAACGSRMQKKPIRSCGHKSSSARKSRSKTRRSCTSSRKSSHKSCHTARKKKSGRSKPRLSSRSAKRMSSRKSSCSAKKPRRSSCSAKCKSSRKSSCSAKKPRRSSCSAKRKSSHKSSCSAKKRPRSSKTRCQGKKPRRCVYTDEDE